MKVFFLEKKNNILIKGMSLEKNLIKKRMRVQREILISSLKGISLAIDTTIIIILAVVVLAVLIGIFFLTSGPFGTNIQAELTRNSNCNAYRNVDIDCDGKEYNDFVKDSNNENMLKELATACNTLKVSGCSGTASLQCIQACCTACGKTTTTISTEAKTCEGRCVPGDSCPTGFASGSCPSGSVCCK